MQTDIQLNDVLAKCDECIAQFMQPNPSVAEQIRNDRTKQMQSYQEQENTQTAPIPYSEEAAKKVANEMAEEVCPGDEFDEVDEAELSNEECLHNFNENVRGNKPFTQEDLENIKKVMYDNSTKEEKESREYFSKMGNNELYVDPNSVRKKVEKKEDPYKNIKSTSLRNKKLVTLEQKWNGVSLEEVAKNTDNAEELYENALTIITSNIVQNYPRVSNIAISDGYIIIDNTVIKFNINVSNLPAQFQSYIQDDRYGFFLDWGYLAEVYKNSLVTVNIDSMEYYISNVGDTLGIGRRIGLSSLFKRFPNLISVTIGNQTIKPDDLTKTPENAKILQRNLGKQKRSFNIMSGYKLNVCAGTNWLQDWSTNNLKTYMTTRGDKGILRFTGGVIGRGAIALVSTTANAASHLTKGVFSGVKEFLKASFETVKESDLKNE